MALGSSTNSTAVLGNYTCSSCCGGWERNPAESLVQDEGSTLLKKLAQVQVGTHHCGQHLNLHQLLLLLLNRDEG